MYESLVVVVVWYPPLGLNNRIQLVDSMRYHDMVLLSLKIGYNWEPACYHPTSASAHEGSL